MTRDSNLEHPYMATLPRATKSPSSSAFIDRPYSQFDAGINTSTAWTEHLESGLSDDDEWLSEHGKPARALYDFEGKAEFRELSVHAGEEIYVIKEDLADGWSLVKNADSEVGLLPRTYYTVSFNLINRIDLISHSLLRTLLQHQTYLSLMCPDSTQRNESQPRMI